MIRAAYTRLTSRLWGTSLVYLASRIVPAALGLVSVKVFYTLLGEAEYGRYAVVVALALLVGNVASTWLGQATLRYRSAHTDPDAHRAFSNALHAGTWASTAAAVVVLGGLLLWRGTSAVGIAGALLAAVTLLHFSVVYGEMQASLRPGRIFVAEALRGVLTLAVPVTFIAFGVRHFATLLVGIGVGNAVGAWWMGGRLHVARIASGWQQRPLLAQFWRYGAPLTVWMGLSMLLNLSDRFVIEWALGQGQVGTYAALYDVVYKSTNLLLTPVLLAAHPVIMSAWNRGGEDEATRLVRRTEVFTVLAALPVLTAWFVGSGFVSRVILGASSTPETIRLVLPISIGAIVWALAMVTHKQLEMRNRTWVMCAMATAALVTQVAINLTLLPAHGLVVAPYAMIASATLYFALVMATRRRPASTSSPEASLGVQFVPDEGRAEKPTSEVLV